MNPGAVSHDDMVTQKMLLCSTLGLMLVDAALNTQPKPPRTQQ